MESETPGVGGGYIGLRYDWRCAALFEDVVFHDQRAAVGDVDEIAGGTVRPVLDVVADKFGARGTRFDVVAVAGVEELRTLDMEQRYVVDIDAVRAGAPAFAIAREFALQDADGAVRRVGRGPRSAGPTRGALYRNGIGPFPRSWHFHRCCCRAHCSSVPRSIHPGKKVRLVLGLIDPSQYTPRPAGTWAIKVIDVMSGQRARATLNVAGPK
jgi:hypothetical protein